MSRSIIWTTGRDCAVQAEPDDTRFEGSLPHALFIGGEHGSMLAVEGTIEEMRAFAARVTAAVATFGTGTSAWDEQDLYEAAGKLSQAHPAWRPDGSAEDLAHAVVDLALGKQV